MGLLRNNDSDDVDSEESSTDEQPVTFEPITTDGNRVLGYLDDPDVDGVEVVWVSDTRFRTIESGYIDSVTR